MSINGVELDVDNSGLILSIKRNPENEKIFKSVIELVNGNSNVVESKFKKRLRGWIDLEISNGEEIGDIISKAFNEKIDNVIEQPVKEEVRPVESIKQTTPTVLKPTSRWGNKLDFNRIILTCSNPNCNNTLKEEQKIKWFANNAHLFSNGLTIETRKELNTDKYKHYCCHSCAAKMHKRKNTLVQKLTAPTEEKLKPTTVIVDVLEKSVEKICKRQKKSDLDKYNHLLRCSCKHCNNWLTAKQAKLWTQKNNIDINKITQDELNSNRYKHYCCRSHAYEDLIASTFHTSMYSSQRKNKYR